jgi:low temperature requirement protein LtrA
VADSSTEVRLVDEYESPKTANSRHASHLELFIDLVFVFAIAQLTSMVAADLSVGGVAKSALIAFILWWQWTTFTWTGTVIDIQADGRSLTLVLGIVPAMLVTAITASRAFNGQAVWFAVSYFIVQLFVLSLHGVTVREDKALRRLWLRYAPLAALAPSLIVLGSFGQGYVRIAMWCVAAMVMIASALFSADGVNESLTIDPVHFAERHSPFVIISLGELIFAIGRTASSESGLATESALAILASAVLACSLWWSYFGFVPTAIESALHNAPPPKRAGLGRDVGSFFHFPLVFAIMLFAVAAEHLVTHPTGHFSSADRLLIFAATATFVGGQILIQLRVVAKLSLEAMISATAMAILLLVGGQLSATLIVAVIAAALAATATITCRRFRTTKLVEPVAG